jgi:segregation and condensation protein A
VPGIRAFESLSEEPEIQVTLFDLISTFKKVLEKAKAQALYEVGRDELTIAQVIERIRQLFERSKGTISVDEIFLAFRSKRNLIVAFLAILEMAYFRAILLTQKKPLGEILARRQDNFEQVLSHMDQWMATEKAPTVVSGKLAIGKSTA